MEHTTMVSRNVPVMDTRPWRTGSFVCAAAAAMGAEPRPASFEKMPRAMPFCMATMMAPSMPPAAACRPNALWKMTANAPGTLSRFVKMSTSEKPTYSTTMAGITRSDTLAMRFRPPMTTRPTSRASSSEPMTVKME